MMDYNKLNQQKQKTIIPYAILFGVGVLFIPLGMALFMGDRTTLIGFFMFLGGGGMIALASYLINKNLNKIKDVIVNEIMKEKGIEGIYQAKNYIAKQVIKDTGMISNSFNQYGGSDYAKFDYKGLTVEYCRLAIYLVTSNGKSTQKTPVYVGPWLIITLDKNLGQTIKIFEKQFFSKGVNNKGLEKIDTESLTFNEKFASYTSDKHTFFYLITPLMIEQLLKHEQAHQGRMLFCLLNDSIHLGMHGEKTKRFKIPLFETINESHTKAISEDFDNIFKVIDNLRLDHDKFKEDALT